MTPPKTINFGAGPAKIPEAVMEKAHSEFLQYAHTGISILEMSHRSAAFMNILNETIKLLKEEMSIPSEYEIIFMQSGGTGQFAAIPLNIGALKLGKIADYAVTGAWSSKAAEEAKKYVEVHKPFTPVKPFVTIPKFGTWARNPDASYLYYCANETVHGIEFPSAPETYKDVPLVADISSNFLSRPFDFSNHGIVFGGTQKNLGAAGVTAVIVRKDLIGKCEHSLTPAVFSYSEIHKNNSVYNTPSVYGIYLTKLVLEWIRDTGGVEKIFDLNRRKSTLIYSTIDESNGFYSCPIDKKYRSHMNIPFRIGGPQGNDQLEKAFLKGAVERGMISLEGHRSVGGIRASLYNAVTYEETEKLNDWMTAFAEQNKH